MPKPPTQAERDAEYKRKVTDVIAAMSPEERKFHADRGTQVVSRLVAEWREVREEIKQLGSKMHPDIVDRFGRTWVWKWDDEQGCNYVHCGRLVPAEWIEGIGTATRAMLDNPNYDLCPTCIDGRKRNITPCDPLWKCSHAVCAEMR